MEVAYDDLTKIFALVSDMRETLTCISCGLENSKGINVHSVLEVYGELLNQVEIRLEDVIHRMELEEKQELIVGIVK